MDLGTDFGSDFAGRGQSRLPLRYSVFGLILSVDRPVPGLVPLTEPTTGDVVVTLAGPSAARCRARYTNLPLFCQPRSRQR